MEGLGDDGLGELVLRGSIFDPTLEAVLDEDSRRILETTDVEDVLLTREDLEPSVLVSLSPHALSYLDLRIALIIRSLYDADVGITLVLRDHQTTAQEDPRLSFAEGKARFLDVLHLLGVPTGDLKVITWTDLASRLAVKEDLYQFLNGIDTVELAGALEQVPVEFRSVTEAYSTLLDIFLASHDSYYPSSWLIGGPTRYPVHQYGRRVYEEIFGRPAVGSIPLPRLPYLPSLPSLVPEPEAQRKEILEDCKSLSQEQLLRLHIGFFDLLEDFLGAKLDARAGVDQPLEKLEKGNLVLLTVDALEQSLEKLQQQVKRAGPEELLQVPPARMPEALEALGHPRRLRILTTVMDAGEGLEAKEILDEMRLPESKMTTLRRDLNQLHNAGLIVAKGVKPITYHPAAEKVELRIDEDVE